MRAAVKADTPILDLVEGVPLYERPQLLARAAQTICGAALGLLPLFEVLQGCSFAASYLLLPVSMYCALAVHEMAHLLAAFCTGARVAELRVGVFRLTWDEDGFGFELTAEGSFGGVVRRQAVDHPKLKSRLILFYAAGPAANLALGVASWIYRGESFILSQIAYTTFIYFVLSMVPAYGAHGPSDGRALAILAMPRQAAQFVALHRISAFIAAKTPPVLWDAQVIEKLTQAKARSVECARAHVFACWHAFLRGDFPRASAFLEEALRRADLADSALRQTIFHLAAAIHHCGRSNAEGAAEWARREKLEQRGPSPALLFQSLFLQ